MLVKLVLIAVVMVIIGLIALRFSRTNSIERSISWHRRRLGSIQGIVERTAERNTRGLEPPVPEPHDEDPSTATPVERKALPARAEIEITEGRRFNDEGHLVFGDLSITPVTPPVPPIYERRPKRAARSARGEHFRVPGERRQGALALVVALVVLLAVIGGGFAYYRHTHPRSGGPVALSTTTTIGTSSSTTTTVPSAPVNATQLISSTASSATYHVLAGSYHVKVDATGPCWVGFEHQATGNKWLSMATIGKSGLNSVGLSTSGPLVIVIGNPPNLKSIAVNGMAIALPKLPSYGFDVIFK